MTTNDLQISRSDNIISKTGDKETRTVISDFKLVLVEQSEFDKYCEYFEELHEFRLFILSHMTLNHGSLKVDNLANPTFLVFTAKQLVSLVDLENRNYTETFVKELLSSLPVNKIWTSNSLLWKKQFKEYFGKRVIDLGEPRRYFDSSKLQTAHLDSIIKKMEIS